MDMYEDGALKDQKLNKKHLTSIPEFKQHLLQLLHHLNAEFQDEILQRVIDEEISLKELKEEATKFRALEAVKGAFIRCTSSRSWDDAVNKFPTFAVEDRLTRFTTMDFCHSIPEVFKVYCQSAISSQIPTQANVQVVDGVCVVLVKRALSTTSSQEIMKVDAAYTGAQLILGKVPKVHDVYLL